MITCKIIADSINPNGDRITTGLWTYPRFIHSEIMTHRMLAKNSASSRAIPVEKMIAAVRENPAMFEQYGAVNKGMQAQSEMLPEDEIEFRQDWRNLRDKCANFAELWKDHAAKQLVNRSLEPWMHMTVIITGTDWKNFFALRAHPAAQPEFQVLAYRWLDVYLKSEPVKMQWGDWHLPFVENFTTTNWDIFEQKRKQSVARCARVSYTRHDAEDTPESCAKLHDRLLESGHMSPFEHQACAEDPAVSPDYHNPYFGCYRGWKPYRKFLPNENRANVDLKALLAAKPDWVTL